MKQGVDIFQYVFGAVIAVVLICLLFFLFKRDVPVNNVTLLSLLVGALISSFTTVVQYFFGSSKGSADKDKIIRNKEE